MKLPDFTPRSDWTPPNLAALPSWSEAKRVALDVETHDPQLTTLGPGVRRDGYIVGVSFAIEDGPAAYLPVAHQAGGNLDRAQVFAYVRDQARAFKGDLVGANLPYDLDFLAEEDVRFTPRFFRDVQVAEPLLDELQYTYGLDAIAERRGIPGKDESMLGRAASALGIDSKKQMWRLHSKFVGAYGEQDVRLPLQLLRLQEREIEEHGLWRIYDLESRLLPVLLKMRRRGVRIDFDHLDRMEAWSIKEEDAALNELARLTGIRLNREDTTKSSAFLPMIQQMGVPIPPTEGTAHLPKDQQRPSLTADWLDTLAGPVGGLINRARKFNKLRGTFVASRRAHAVKGRVHPTFVQLRSEKPGADDDGGARYGRCASRDPNLQQEPARDEEIGPEWRKVYLPEEGSEWACLDYSQQEPRWAVHYAEELKEKGASAAGDRYRNDPSTDNHDMMTILIYGQEAWDSWDKPTRKAKRGNAKNIFLGLCYGEGEAKLCHDVDLPTVWEYRDWAKRKVEVAGPEGRRLLDLFHRKVPWLAGTSRRASKFAAKNGFVRTVLGRRCRFPVALGPNGKPKRDRLGRLVYDWTHKAFNRVIQGSSGDQMKKAMVDADEAGLVTEDLSRDSVALQVHDELDGSFADRNRIRQLAEIMRTAVKCRVPHKVDAEVGPNWADIKKLES